MTERVIYHNQTEVCVQKERNESNPKQWVTIKEWLTNQKFMDNDGTEWEGYEIVKKDTDAHRFEIKLRETLKLIPE